MHVVVSEKSIILKFICRYKSFEAKNKDNLVETNLLLFVANSAIGNLSNLSSN